MNEGMVGSTYVAEPFEVSAVKIAEFARATHAENRAHFDAEAAAKVGAPAVVAPPTFVVSTAQAAEKLFLDDPRSGADFSRIVHGGEELSFVRPIVAGDVLTTDYTVESVTVKATLTITRGRSEVRDQRGMLVATAVSTMIQREGK